MALAEWLICKETGLNYYVSFDFCIKSYSINEKFYKYLVLNWNDFEADFEHFKKFGKWQH